MFVAFVLFIVTFLLSLVPVITFTSLLLYFWVSGFLHCPDPLRGKSKLGGSSAHQSIEGAANAGAGLKRLEKKAPWVPASESAQSGVVGRRRRSWRTSCRGVAEEQKKATRGG